MKIAVVPGSFDPVTLGHINLIERAAKAFDLVYAVSMINDQKKYMFSIEQRAEMLEKSVEHIENVKVESYKGWLYDYVLMKDASAIVKGIRNQKDFVYEAEMADFNKKYSQVDTFFIVAEDRFKKLSSTFIKENLDNRVDLSDFLAQSTIKYMKRYLKGDLI